MRGDVLLTVLNERFELAIPAERADTVSGYVWQHLGRLPAVGDTVPLPTAAEPADGFDESDPVDPPVHLRVDAVDGTLVERVSFLRPTPTTDEGRQ